MLKALREALADAARLFDAGQSKAAANDMRALETVLSGSDGDSVGDAIKQLNEKLAQAKLALRTKYLTDLKASIGDRETFDLVLRRLDKDKSISKDDADAIAHGLIGGRTSWTNRKTALSAVKSYFVEREYRDAKLRNVDKAKVW